MVGGGREGGSHMVGGGREGEALATWWVGVERERH